MREQHTILKLNDYNISLEDLFTTMRITANSNAQAYYCLRESQKSGSVSVTVVMPLSWNEVGNNRNLNYRITKINELYQFDPNQFDEASNLRQLKFEKLDDAVNTIVDQFRTTYPSRSFSYLSDQKLQELVEARSPNLIQAIPSSKNENTNQFSIGNH